jgi:hypothetical protein
MFTLHADRCFYDLDCNVHVSQDRCFYDPNCKMLMFHSDRFVYDLMSITGVVLPSVMLGFSCFTGVVFFLVY